MGSHPTGTPTACFSIVGRADPAFPAAVMAALAEMGAMPSAWYGRVRGEWPGEVEIDLQVPGLALQAVERLARRFRTMPTVSRVLTSDLVRTDEPC